MQNRSNRGSGKPVWVKAHQARAFDWDPIPRIALGPAVMSTASTGRTHDCTRPACTYLKTTLANREPSTHDPERTFEVTAAILLCRFGEGRRNRRGRKYVPDHRRLPVWRGALRGQQVAARCSVLPLSNVPEEFRQRVHGGRRISSRRVSDNTG